MAWFFNSKKTSKESAKKRLQLVLMHDRASINPQLLDKLKEELLQVIEKYVEIDTSGMEISLDGDKRTVALVANIPIKGTR
ncbi:MAG: cell division topological specificity factor MinE [Deferribacteres bacterium]|nr:cell division topological specificity factor MinE [candidate division KSB1 bacterium]MCB9510053.1 cell division topological specificity factor MinE [Deferribacteres bacterium]